MDRRQFFTSVGMVIAALKLKPEASRELGISQRYISFYDALPDQHVTRSDLYPTPDFRWPSWEVAMREQLGRPVLLIE